MGEKELRSALIRLAYQNPEVRPRLLSVLGRAEVSREIPKVPGVSWVEEKAGKLWIGIKKRTKPQRVEHIRRMAEQLLRKHGVNVTSSTTSPGKAPTKGVAGIVIEFAPA